MNEKECGGGCVRNFERMTSVRRIEMDCPVLPAPSQAKESRAQLMESTARYTSTGEKDGGGGAERTRLGALNHGRACKPDLFVPQPRHGAKALISGGT